MPVKHKSCLSIGCWNIQCLGDKLNCQEVAKCIRECDIICLQETHCSYSDELDLNGYRIVNHIRPKSPGAKKFFGGMSVFVKEELRPGIKFIKQDDPDVMWIKLCKSFFSGLDNDMFICSIYVSPESSPYHKRRSDLFEILKSDVLTFSSQGRCIVLGDLNAYTNTQPDFISSDVQKLLPVPSDYVMDNPTSRANRDTRKANQNGSKLLDLCKETGLRVVNGRCFGDLIGNFTHFPLTENPSVIDYMLVDEETLDLVNTFEVDDLTPFSDHCKISAQLKIAFSYDEEGPRSNLLDIPIQFKWKDEDSIKFMAACTSVDVQKLNKDFLSLKMYDFESVNTAVDKFSAIIYKACEIAGVRRVQVGRKRKKQPKSVNKKWFDKECLAVKKELKYWARNKSKYPFSVSIRDKYYSLYKKYKRLLRNKKKHFQSSIMDRMNNLYERNQKAYWRAVKDMSDFGRSNDGNPIPVDRWIEHFRNLMSVTNIDPGDNFTQFIRTQVADRPAIFNELDYRISQEEVLGAIKKLKRGKAASVDGILNEMLKDNKSNKRVMTVISLALEIPIPWSSKLVISRLDPCVCPVAPCGSRAAGVADLDI